ncbi:MAG: zinc ribbon domain-containing protein [Lachnospiraceae bacterium]|nr:zinc ribbon domain-containing protein [Lachnospiraceae bacterium]
MDKKCPNCGADIGTESTQCPYCGYINEKNAEKKYMDNLYEVKKSLGEVDDEAESYYRENFRHTFRLIAVTVGILAVVSTVIFFVYSYNSREEYQKDITSGEDILEEMTWKQDAFKMFDKLYMMGKYDELCLAVTGSESLGHSVDSYEHYLFVELYNDYLETVSELEGVKDNGWNGYTAGMVFFYCCTYYYTGTGELTAFEGLTEEELEKLKPQFEFMEDVLHNRLMFSDEDMKEYAGSLITEYGYLDYEACTGLAKEKKQEGSII